MSPKKAEKPEEEVKAVEPVKEEAIEVKSPEDEKAEQYLALMAQDIGKLTLTDQARYLNALARSMHLNPFLKPFDLLKDDSGKVIIYANRGCADQLADLRKLTTVVLYRGPMMVGETGGQPQYNTEIWMVVVEVRDPEGRVTQNIGVSHIGNATGKGLATLLMKTETKAIRRARLSHVGVGFPDVEELDYIPNVKFEGPRTVEPPALPQGTVTVVQPTQNGEKVAPAVPAPPVSVPKPPVRPPVVPPRAPRTA